MSIFWSNGFWSFIVLTVILGGSAAWMSGRAVARNWRALWLLGLYCLFLALAVRFLHFALFQSVLLSTPMLLIDLIVMLFFGFVGITDVSFVYAEGLNMGDESKEKAMSEARAALQ